MVHLCWIVKSGSLAHAKRNRYVEYGRRIVGTRTKAALELKQRTAWESLILKNEKIVRRQGVVIEL